MKTEIDIHYIRYINASDFDDDNETLSESIQETDWNYEDLALSLVFIIDFFDFYTEFVENLDDDDEYKTFHINNLKLLENLVEKSNTETEIFVNLGGDYE